MSVLIALCTRTVLAGPQVTSRTAFFASLSCLIALCPVPPMQKVFAARPGLVAMLRWLIQGLARAWPPGAGRLSMPCAPRTTSSTPLHPQAKCQVHGKRDAKCTAPTHQAQQGATARWGVSSSPGARKAKTTASTSTSEKKTPRGGQTDSTSSWRQEECGAVRAPTTKRAEVVSCCGVACACCVHCSLGRKRQSRGAGAWIKARPSALCREQRGVSALASAPTGPRGAGAGATVGWVGA